MSIREKSANVTQIRMVESALKPAHNTRYTVIPKFSSWLIGFCIQIRLASAWVADLQYAYEIPAETVSCIARHIVSNPSSPASRIFTAFTAVRKGMLFVLNPQ